MATQYRRDVAAQHDKITQRVKRRLARDAAQATELARLAAEREAICARLQQLPQDAPEYDDTMDELYDWDQAHHWLERPNGEPPPAA